MSLSTSPLTCLSRQRAAVLAALVIGVSVAAFAVAIPAAADSPRGIDWSSEGSEKRARSVADAPRESARENRGKGANEPLLERWRRGSPQEREEIRRSAYERLQGETPKQRRRLARRMQRFEKALPKLDALERLILVRVVSELPGTDRRDIARRLEGIDSMSASERAAFERELLGLIQGFDAEVHRLERNRDRWRDFSEDERNEYREQMRRLRGMSLDDRRRILQQMDAKPK